MNDAYVLPSAPLVLAGPDKRRSRGGVIPFRPRGTAAQFPALPGMAHPASAPEWFAAPSPWLASIPKVQQEAHVRGLNDRKVRFHEGPPWPSKTYHLEGSWLQRSDRAKLRLLRKYAKEYGKDPRIRQFVIKYVLEPKGMLFPSRQFEGQQRAILAWIQQNIAYVNETGELLQGPWHTLKVRSGDCDDMALLGAAMAESLMIPWRFVLAGKHGNGRPARWAEGTPKPFGVKFQHIYLDFGEPGRKGLWRAAEPTMSVPLGFDVVLHGKPGNGRIDGRATAGWGDGGTLGALDLASLPGRILGVPLPELPSTAVTWGQRIAAATILAITVRLMVDKVWRSKRFKRTFHV